MIYYISYTIYNVYVYKEVSYVGKPTELRLITQKGVHSKAFIKTSFQYNVTLINQLYDG